jgi:hypothetical protein
MTTGLELVLDEFARKRLDGGQLFERHDGWSARLDLCPRNKAASASVRTETNEVNICGIAYERAITYTNRWT